MLSFLALQLLIQLNKITQKKEKKEKYVSSLLLLGRRLLGCLPGRRLLGGLGSLAQKRLGHSRELLRRTTRLDNSCASLLELLLQSLCHGHGLGKPGHNILTMGLQSGNLLA